MKVLTRPTHHLIRLPKLIRVSPYEPVRCQILTDEPLVIQVHHIERRTIPCLPDPCPFCKGREPQSQRCVLPICDQQKGRYRLLDLPCSMWFELREHLDQDRKIMPYIWRFRRKYTKANAPIDVACRPIMQADHKMNEKTDYLSEWDAIHASNLQFAIQRIETAK